MKKKKKGNLSESNRHKRRERMSEIKRERLGIVTVMLNELHNKELPIVPSLYLEKVLLF